MALFLGCQRDIAARFGAAQPNFKNLPRLHLVQREPHEHKSHRTGFRNNINGLVWLWGGDLHSYGCRSSGGFFFLNGLKIRTIQ